MATCVQLCMQSFILLMTGMCAACCVQSPPSLTSRTPPCAAA